MASGTITGQCLPTAIPGEYGVYPVVYWSSWKNPNVDNQSIVSVSVKLHSGGVAWGGANATVWVSGSTVGSKTKTCLAVNGSGDKDLWAADWFYVNHNANGTKSVTITFQRTGMNVSYGSTKVTSLYASGTVTLDKLEGTSLSAPTGVKINYCDRWVGNTGYPYAGEELTVSWNAVSGAESYTVEYGYSAKYEKAIDSWGTLGSYTGTISSADSWNSLSGRYGRYRVKAVRGAISSPWAYSAYIRIDGGLSVNASGNYTRGTPYIRVNGAWKRAKRVWVNVGGAWKMSI